MRAHCTNLQLDYELEISMRRYGMKPKAKSTIASQKLRANNLIVFTRVLTVSLKF